MTPQSLLTSLVISAVIALLNGCAISASSPRDLSNGTPLKILVKPNTVEKPAASLFFQRKKSRSYSDEELKEGFARPCIMVPILGCIFAAVALPIMGALKNVSESGTSENFSAYDISTLGEPRHEIEETLTADRPALLVSHRMVDLIQARTAHDVRLETREGRPEALASEQRIDGLIEVHISKYGLVADSRFEPGDKNPAVKLLISVGAIFYSTEDGKFQKSLASEWEKLGRQHWLEELIANNGSLLRDEIENAAKELAEDIVQSKFFSNSMIRAAR